MDYSQEIKNCIKTLKQSGTILYPTDTVWGIGCDAADYGAIKKIYELKKREENKAMICLVTDFKMLEYYVENIPEAAYQIMKYTNKPTTIIYDNPIRVSENLVGEDNTLAIRVVRKGFAHELVKRYGRCIVSTSANISGEPTPNSRKDISSEILKGVDYVVNLQNEKSSSTPSTIIRLGNDGEVKVIRK